MTKKIEADEYADQKEQIVDNAMLFIKDPSDFWNRAPVQIQKSVQRTLFPRGLDYDFENGFGTIELNESYLLLQKIASEDAIDSIVVATSGLAAFGLFHCGVLGASTCARPRFTNHRPTQLALLVGGSSTAHDQEKAPPCGEALSW